MCVGKGAGVCCECRADAHIVIETLPKQKDDVSEASCRMQKRCIVSNFVITRFDSPTGVPYRVTEVNSPDVCSSGRVCVACVA